MPQAGRIIVHYTSPKCRIKRWLIWAAACGLIGGGLCGFSRDGGVIPVNKNLWSLSFTLVMASFGFIMLSVFYYLIDVARIWSGAPFRYVGLNSIVVYLTSEVMSEYFPLSWDWHYPVTHAEVLFMNLTAVTCLCVMAYYMYSINFFIKI
jgi:heparan-alpha-glucosaminide N-acetyltransferase